MGVLIHHRQVWNQADKKKTKPQPEKMSFSLKRTVNSFQTHKQLKKFLVNKEHGVPPQLQPTVRANPTQTKR